MALRTYNSDAWGDIEDLKTPEVDNARQTAECAKIYQNDAWEEVWAAIKYMSLLECTFTNAEADYATSTSHDHMVWAIYSEKNDGGYATYYLEGDFSNPTVSFDWYAFMYYTVSDGSTHYAAAGDISIYTRTTSGTENYTTAVSQMGSDTTGDSGSYSNRFSGNFDRVGFKIKLRNWGANESYYDISIWNFLIDGTECIPSEECIYN